MDGFSRIPGNETLYLRYYDAALPKPSDSDSFEYTIPSNFLSWAIPEDSERADSERADSERPDSERADSERAGSTSEGDSNASSEGVVKSSPHLRRSSRRIPVKAATLQYRRLLHVLHKHVP